MQESNRESSSAGPVDRLPPQGRLAGVDFGTVRIGLAICDPSQTWVTPFDTYVRRGVQRDARFFRDLASQESLVGWVVGLPIHCDGQESQKSREVRDFAVWLQDATRLPYLFYDERFSTAEARELLQATEWSGQKKKQQLDRVAAHLILSHYLDSHRLRGSQNEALDDAKDPL